VHLLKSEFTLKHLIMKNKNITLILCIAIGIITFCSSCADMPQSTDNVQSLAPRSTQTPVPITVMAYDPTQSNDTIKVKIGIKGDCVQLFGMNVRFIYQSDKLTFLRFSDYADGYGPVLPNPPRSNLMKAGAGLTLFNLSGNVTYINGAVQLSEGATPDTCTNTETPTHYFSLVFKVKNASECPVIVLDKKNTGGGFSGSDGLVATIVSQPGSGYQSAPTIVTADHLNWICTSNALPYGSIDNDDCISN